MRQALSGAQVHQRLKSVALQSHDQSDRDCCLSRLLLFPTISHTPGNSPTIPTAPIAPTSTPTLKQRTMCQDLHAMFGVHRLNGMMSRINTESNGDPALQALACVCPEESTAAVCNALVS
jgi:hypothetical protein